MQVATNVMVQKVSTRHWYLTSYYSSIYRSDTIRMGLDVLFLGDLFESFKIERINVLCKLIRKMSYKCISIRKGDTNHQE